MPQTPRDEEDRGHGAERGDGGEIDVDAPTLARRHADRVHRVEQHQDAGDADQRQQGRSEQRYRGALPREGLAEADRERDHQRVVDGEQGVENLHRGRGGHDQRADRAGNVAVSRREHAAEHDRRDVERRRHDTGEHPGIDPHRVRRSRSPRR